MIITRLELVDLLKCLSDEINLKILSYIRNYEELCVCQFEDILDIPQPTISRHLRSLYMVGLVSVRKEGRWHFYSLVNLPKFVYEVLDMATERYSIKKDIVFKKCNTKNHK